MPLSLLKSSKKPLPNKQATYSIQSRLLKVLLIGLPVIWLGVVGTVGVMLWQQMSKLGDAQMMQLSTYMLASSVEFYDGDDDDALRLVEDASLSQVQTARLKDFEDEYTGFAIWDGSGRLLMADDNGEEFLFRSDRQGFINTSQGINPLEDRWRLLYVRDEQHDRVLAVGQNLESRQEMIMAAMLAQLLPVVCGLLLFLLLVWWSIRRGFAPLTALSKNIQARDPASSSPLDVEVPKEVQPLIDALNRWFVKVAEAISREERFTADASHELKSPLTAMKLQADMLEQAILTASLDEADERTLFEHSLAIKAGIERSNHLVGQLLTLAKLSADDRQAMVFDQKIDWQAITETVLSQSNLFARQKHSQLIRLLNDEPMTLYGDETLIEILLTNLIDNAIRYCPEGSHIWLEIGRSAICVYDDGMGVDEAHLSRLSERFFRPSGQVQSGSGLGLSIVLRICQLHGLQADFANRYQDKQRIGFSVTITPKS